MSNIISAVVESSLSAIMEPLADIFDQLHLSSEEEAEIAVKIKKLENNFLLEMNAIDSVIEYIANNIMSQINILISYAHDHPENKKLRMLLTNLKIILGTFEEYEKSYQD